MKKISFILLAILLMILPLTVSAHSGRTDDNGGHYDRSAGKYHYHHGYPAHQHENGICPYNYLDNEKDNENNSYIDSVDETTRTYKSSYQTSTYTTKKEVSTEKKTYSTGNKSYFSRNTAKDYIGYFFISLLLTLMPGAFAILLIPLTFDSIYNKIFKEYSLDEYTNYSMIGIGISIFSLIYCFCLKEFLIGTVISISVFLITFIIWLIFSRHLHNKQKKKEKEEYEKLLIYKNKTHTEIFNIINKTNIDFDISKIKENPIFTVYTTYSGQKYHQSYKCCGAVNKNFIFETTKQPCSLCCHGDNSMPITKEQYKNYKDLLKKLESHNIEIHE